MDKPPEQRKRSNYIPFGMIAGMLVGTTIYGVTHYVPAIALGALLGLTVGIVLHAISRRAPV